MVLLIAAAVAIDIFLLMRSKSSGTTLLEDLFPTPTTERKVILTRNAETAVYQVAMATASVPPTMTTIPFTPAPKTATFAPTLAAPTATMPASTLLSPSAEVVAVTLTPTQTLSSILSDACIPNTPAQRGKVIDIIDGYTIRVLIDGLVYTARYLGIELPEDENYAGRASAVNGELVFGKEISLIADSPEIDQLYPLLRYVKLDETFVNLELIQQGLATTKNTDPPFSCAEVFKNAEQSAREARRGIWKNAPEP